MEKNEKIIKPRWNEIKVELKVTYQGSDKPREETFNIAAICHGQQIMISAGILNGRNATCYPGIKDDLINAGAVYEDKEVVVCENLVTSRRPEDLPFFMREFLRIIRSI